MYFFYQILSVVIIGFIFAISAILLGFLARILKMIFKSERAIEKVSLVFFIIISCILILIKGADFTIEYANSFSNPSFSFWRKVGIFFTVQIWLSIVSEFFSYIYAILASFYSLAAGINQDEFDVSAWLGVPLFMFSLFHIIPVLSLILSFFN